MRLVDANELEKWMNERMRSLRAAYGYHDAYTDGFEECMEAVENAETIDPATLRPTGRWVHNDEYVLWAEKYVCSVCGRNALSDGDYRHELSDYCPHCGAKMMEG